MPKSSIPDEIKKALEDHDGKWNEKKGVWDFSTIIAERKAFLSKKKLTYTLKFKVDDDAKAVKFSEMLIEAGSGITSGGGFDDGMSPGFGFKTESYNTLNGSRQGTIEEKSALFSKEYSYTFDYKAVRTKVKAVVERAGYQFEYQILPIK
jgi:hypothetical protein